MPGSDRQSDAGADMGGTGSEAHLTPKSDKVVADPTMPPTPQPDKGDSPSRSVKSKSASDGHVHFSPPEADETAALDLDVDITIDSSTSHDNGGCGHGYGATDVEGDNATNLKHRRTEGSVGVKSILRASTDVGTGPTTRDHTLVERLSGVSEADDHLTPLVKHRQKHAPNPPDKGTLHPHPTPGHNRRTTVLALDQLTERPRASSQLSVVGATANFTKQCLGAGILAFAGNAYNGGMWSVLLLLPLASVLSIFTAVVLVQVVEKLEERNPVQIHYLSIMIFPKISDSSIIRFSSSASKF